jgi:2-keto-4-pentenoate hydratase/2-oxohepta-3-ene-1,7-dioic acid hydratase in catechol pathway
MKLVTYRCDGRDRVGVLCGDGVHDAGFDGDMVALIEVWEDNRERVRRAAETSHAVAGARLLAPLRPRSMRDFLAFEAHLIGAMGALGRSIPDEWYRVPAYYKGMPDTVIGPGEDVPLPTYSNHLDVELELAAVIGRAGRDITPERALEHIFGWTIWNDVSARDTQARELPVGMGPAKAKDWDGSNVLGPCLVTRDELDGRDVRMRLEVNGVLWGEDRSGSMHHRFEDLIAYASQCQTLYAGEVFGSGTSAGGSGIETGRRLSPGDVIAMEVEGIGVLRNRLGRETAREVAERERAAG